MPRAVTTSQELPDAPSQTSDRTKVFLTAAAQALRLVLAATTGAILARTLQPDGRGVYAVITTIATTAIIIGHLSVPHSQIAFWGDRLVNRALTANGLILGLVSGAVAGICTVALTPLILPYEALLLAAAVLVAAPLGVAACNLQRVLLLEAQVATSNHGILLSALVQCVPTAVLAATGNVTIATVIVIWCAATVLPLGLYVWKLRPAVAHADRGLALRQLNLSYRYHIGLISLHLLMTIDVLLLNAMTSPAEVGIYTVAVSVLSLANVPADAILQVVLPRQAAQDMTNSRSATVRALRWTIPSSLACVGMLAAASPVVVPLMYGDAYEGSIAALMVLAPGIAALSMVRLMEQYLIRLQRPLSMAGLCMGALAVNVALNLMWIPRWGAVGAALSSTVAYGLLALAQFIRFARALPSSTDSPLEDRI
ncbi:lipopolysaccharide biosynthesis protein [Nonomuraea polychroma]|uniref:lipopolysaccharide biosynthesis protein n=1 Tax=Nonomuraea polychroma TaxID=46176 RepID=UPI003D900528